MRLRSLNGARAATRLVAGVALLALHAAFTGSAYGADAPEARLAACLACHGADGTSRTPGVPSLGGQPAYFITIQLYLFREKLRAVEPMNQMLLGAGNDDLRNMADALSRLPPPAPAGASDPERMAKARSLAEQHRCNFCHNADYSGAENVPRLAGQREDYLAKTLRDYKSGVRRGYDASMADVLHPLSDEDVLDLAYFLARVR